MCFALVIGAGQGFGIGCRLAVQLLEQKSLAAGSGREATGAQFGWWTGLDVGTHCPRDPAETGD